MPEIRPVTLKNWQELSQLQVREDQANHVATNLQSIAETQFGFDDKPEYGHWDAASFGIYDKNAPIGYFLLGYNYSNPETQGYVIRLMVDEEFQGKGYGRFAMNWILSHFREDELVKTVAINYKPDNCLARSLYASFGFVETGEIEENGEVVTVLHLR